MIGLTAERLRDVLHYDPETGVFTWRVTNSYTGRAGQTAGSKGEDREYVVIGIDRKRYMAHRLAWLYMTGEWPPECIDHINLNKKDNRFSNLRLASKADNERNKPRSKKNTTGYKGVTWMWDKKKFKADIRVNGKRHYLGYFATAKEAHEAYCRAAALHFGDFARPE